MKYLGDEGQGGQNAYVPVAKYVMVMNKYVLMAGDVQEPDLLYISSEETSGVWKDADDLPNEPLNKAVNIRITKKINTNTGTINGIARYRDKVVVAFDDVIALGSIGDIVNVGTEATPDLQHVPVFDDAIEAHGCISHRSMQFLGDDLLMADLVGVASLARSAISDSITPSRPSELIDPALQQAVGQLTKGGALNNIFSVYNLLEKQYMLFVPNHEDNPLTLREPELLIVDFVGNQLLVSAIDHNLDVGDTVEITLLVDTFNTFTMGELLIPHTVATVIDADNFTIIVPSAIPLDPDGDLHNRSSNPNNALTTTALRTESLGFVLNHRKTGKNIKAWSRFRGWNWTCGCRTLLGRMMFATEDTIYVYGNAGDPSYQDFLCSNSSTPAIAAFTRSGVECTESLPISWSWELPWHDFKKRMKIKRLKYLGMDTSGDSDYTISAFIDDIYKDNFGHLDPALQMHVYGRDSGGFGAGSQPYGGGRRMQGERLYAWPTKFKLLKLRFEGQSTRPLRIISILLALSAGSIRR